MTMAPLAPPSRNPTVDGNLRTLLAFVFRKIVQHDLDDMLPAQVIAYDRATNMASVQPLIDLVTTLDTLQARASIQKVPVLQLGGGGFTLNFPIKPGDLGFIKANDRDISLFTQLWRQVQPNTGRMHSFQDGIFIPSVLTGMTISGPDSANVVLQSLNGSIRLSLGANNACISDTEGYAESVNCVLDVQSTHRALAFPRMTTGQKNAIQSPFPGMAVFDTTEDGLSVYTAVGGWS